MERLPFEERRFTQAQVLKLVPSLPAKTLQNWVSRGIIETAEASPGRQGKRLWTPAGIILLRSMTLLTSLGIPPVEAVDISHHLVEYAAGFYEVYPVHFEENGRPSWIIAGDEPEIYHRAIIFRADGRHRAILVKGELGMRRTIFPMAYLVIEIDQLLCSVFNRLHLLAMGLSLDGEGITASDPEARETMEALTRLSARLDTPGRR